MNESRMRSSSRCTSSIKTRLGYCRIIQLRLLLTCLAMIAIRDETDEGCEQQSTADATPSDLAVGVLVVFDAYSSGKTKKRRIAWKYNNKANCFFPVTPPCCGTGLSVTFPDHQGESSGRQRGLLERQEGRICWRTRRWGVNVFEHHTMTCWQQLYLNPPCCHLGQTNPIPVGLMRSAFSQTGVLRLGKCLKLYFWIVCNCAMLIL